MESIDDISRKLSTQMKIEKQVCRLNEAGKKEYRHGKVIMVQDERMYVLSEGELYELKRLEEEEKGLEVTIREYVFQKEESYVRKIKYEKIDLLAYIPK
jgi:hypothetical protein